ncbi:unnamed protein product [Fusarium graminearum]|uniref:Chromosome 1, complete genome n=1 Tax=Gibberella zeae (strain ATCC MYA-4620 / CBS 123657 / FGSC 9075 / NRRL 31084 / PH-1) TaxID=229533 RepID=I1S4H7_GIBZE|nr:hypothetical protein FGSG_11744 [Fusarium graminearum PH-1]ESU05477.1 hypothetical protein FGSG_11744 [Fusarium graminearum PH-1]CEF72218.1 unnamed protein product [Fusarium graminearum]CZS75480.1 unnamed protein product [Fusarium graminearum]|eukprot:XP_011315962.1 hypothetical protein FGSG_11744 [Fusarium graminearum PH-1]
MGQRGSGYETAQAQAQPVRSSYARTETAMNSAISSGFGLTTASPDFLPSLPHTICWNTKTIRPLGGAITTCLQGTTALGAHCKCQHARPVPNTTDSTIPHQSSLYPPCYTDKKPNGPRSQGRD